MEKRIFGVCVVFLFVLCFKAIAFCHCEIPCGIYDDEMRVKMIEEDIATIEKCMKQIVQLQKEKDINYNQLVRWITNKDDHANKLQEIVSRYFMTQRIKIDSKNYNETLSLLHQMLIYGMKCKQTTDLSNIETLRELVKKFRKQYFSQ